MGKPIDLATFQKLEALQFLIEENDLARMEMEVTLSMTDHLLQWLGRTLASLTKPEVIVKGIQAMQEGIHTRSLIEMERVRERQNHELFFSKTRELLEEFDLWKEPTMLSQLKR